MFESLSDRLSGVFDRLRGRGALNEADVRAAMREVRVALLEADVALPVVREFVDKATEQAVGQQVLKSVTPGQQVVKIVHDTLVEMLGADESDLALDVTPPAVIMMVGLQGSGKTTTTAKLAKRLTERERKKVMMASLDVNRPAAQEQLAVLGAQANVATLPIVLGQQPIEIARRALQSAKLQGYDVLLLDTAGRLHVDQALMDEMKAIADVSSPQEILLVVDALTGQDAVNVARNFSDQVDLSGVILTRLDGDARGGAALSMRAVTGRPAPARRSTRSKAFIRSAWRAASLAWATSSAWSSAPARRSRSKRPRRSPARWPRASSTSTIFATSSCRCSAWAGSALWPACSRA
jgi:signal recognition particle subunit SRP54